MSCEWWRAIQCKAWLYPPKGQIGNILGFVRWQVSVESTQLSHPQPDSSQGLIPTAGHWTVCASLLAHLTPEWHGFGEYRQTVQQNDGLQTKGREGGQQVPEDVERQAERKGDSATFFSAVCESDPWTHFLLSPTTHWFCLKMRALVKYTTY